MANRITSIKLNNKQLGDKVKATFKSERAIYVDGTQLPARVYVASTALHPDFEIVVPHLKNSIVFNGRKEVQLEDIELVASARTNNIGNTSRSLEFQVFAKKLTVKE